MSMMPPNSTDECERQALLLLRPGEHRVPPAVQRACQFLRRLGIWFALSRNLEARSCRDAARKRQRLGHQGIPLWDELKSFFGRYSGADGQHHLVMVHCRADRQLNMEKVAAALGAAAPPVRLTEEEMVSLRLEYGMVNPFETWHAEPARSKFTLDLSMMDQSVIQLFDEELRLPIGVPGTMMTNAGELTWAVEFRADDLIRTLPKSVVAPISEPDLEEPSRIQGARNDHPIGIITGNPPEAGMYLWQLMNNKVRESLGDLCCGDVSMPRVEMMSLPETGLSMEMESRLDVVSGALEQAVREMCRRGVKALALPCNTMSYFAPKIHEWCAGTQTRFESMAEVTGRSLRRAGITEVALVGINYAADLGHWSAYREPLAGMKIELLNGEALERVRELAYLVKSEGPNHPLLSKLRDILNKHVTSKHVVLALTELSLLVELQKGGGKSGKVIIDPMSLYAESLAATHLGGSLS